MFIAAGATDQGCVRTANQDRILVETALDLYVVADGMGGHRHGELAAELAIETMRYYMACSKDLSDATWPFGYNFELSTGANRLVTSIQLANRQVWNRAQDSPECAGMGTTIAAILVCGNVATVANAGDSRVYLLRAGGLHQLSTDDTWVHNMLRRGLTDESSLRNHPMRNVLTQAAGSQEQLDVHTVEPSLQPGDELLICSDGLHGVITESEILPILALPEPEQNRVDWLIRAARAGGGPDNVSCILVHYEPSRME
jgi:serine/threonine protein phosphatase PrpC